MWLQTAVSSAPPDSVSIKGTSDLEDLYVKLCGCLQASTWRSMSVGAQVGQRQGLCVHRVVYLELVCESTNGSGGRGGGACEGMTLWIGARVEAFILSCASGCLLVKLMFTVHSLWVCVRLC